MKKIKDTIISLDLGDAAFVWRRDGGTELVINRMDDDDDDVEPDSPDFQAFCITILFSDDPEATELRGRLLELSEEIANREEDTLH